MVVENSASSSGGVFASGAEGRAGAKSEEPFCQMLNQIMGHGEGKRNKLTIMQSMGQTTQSCGVRKGACRGGGGKGMLCL